MAQPMLRTAGGGSTRAGFEHPVDVGPRREPGRSDAEEGAGQDGAEKSEQENAPVESHGKAVLVPDRETAPEEIASPDREHDPGRASEEGDDQALDEQLRHQAPAA